ncbi:MAG: 2-C-methyl-D-erythritol 4-phosphate cytidylyltransferase, partial [Tannerella sp.]|nr:2-C-methyl-D-erythritol 4-phosphate cytidylyltransferase [Tannerella sp.]
MKRTVIIVAGGKGLRMGGGLPKQFVPLLGKPVLMHTLEVFYGWDAGADLLLVIPEDQASYWAMLCRELNCIVPHRIVYGGDTRFDSVKNGLKATTTGEGIIAVHDGVRPFVSPDVISSCFAAAGAFGAAIPVVPVIESVRERKGYESRPFDRNRLCIVQTPQVF